MFLQILKKDLARKKVMNLTLFLFIILAVMFVSSGWNNVLVAMNGMDETIRQANIGDYYIYSSSENSKEEMKTLKEKIPEMKEYWMDQMLGCGPGMVEGVGTDKREGNGNVLFQVPDERGMHFFDESNKQIRKVREGHVWVGGTFLQKNGLKKGDKIKVKSGEKALILTIDGKSKDVIFGTDFTGGDRFLISEEDSEFLKSAMKGALQEYYTYYVDVTDGFQMGQKISEISEIRFNADTSLFRMCYLIDLIFLFMILLLSVCLSIVSVIIIKFSIMFHINESFREIGVMKAIGISNRRIRGLYIAKYLFLTILGAVVGLICSIPFGNLLISSLSRNLILESKFGIFPNIAGAILVSLVVLLFAWHHTGKAKKISPLEAFRNGESGERYKKKSGYRLGKSRVGTTLYLAWNDILSSPRRFLGMAVSFCLLTTMLLVTVTTANTMDSSAFATVFGAKSDLYFRSSEQAGTFEDEWKETEKLGENLNSKKMPAKMFQESLYQLSVSYNGAEYSITCFKGRGTEMTDYEYLEGSVPQNENEIAITKQVAGKTGAKIGDKLTIHFGDEEKEMLVVAYYQSMTNMGNTIRLHNDVKMGDEVTASGWMTRQILFTDSPSEQQIQERKQKIRKLYPDDKVLDAKEFCVETMGAKDMVEQLTQILLGVIFVVITLMVLLMERTFVADEVGQIAILKAIGFKNTRIIQWHALRFGIIAFLSVLAAAALSIPVTKLCIVPVFEMMGSVKVDFVFDKLQLFLIYPGIICIGTIGIAGCVSLYTRKVAGRDTASLE